MKKIFAILPLLVAPLLSSCVYNNGINDKQKDFTITGVTFDVEKIELKVGNDPKSFTPTIVGEGEFTETYKISIADETIATISAKDGKNGDSFKVTAVKNGDTVITVTPDGDASKKATLNLSVNETGGVVAVEAVSLDTSILELKVGEEHQFVESILPADATNQLVRYESSNQDVLTVDDNGLAKAIAKGEAIIKVTTVDGGKEAQCNVTVKSNDALKVGSYYLYGTPNEWKADADYILEKNESLYSDKEYKINFAAKANDEFKVAQYNGDAATNWYSVDASESGRGENAASYVEFQSTGDLNMKILKDGKFTLYFDLNAKGSGNYKYWIELQLN